MSLPKDNPPDPLVASVMRTAASGPASGCPDAELLGLHAEQALTGDERAAIEAHVAVCDRCQATLAAFVRSAPEPASAPAGIGMASPWWAGWRWLVPIASATAVVAVAVWIGRGPSNEVAEQARAAGSASPAEAPRTPAAFAPDVLNERDAAVSGAGADAVPAGEARAAGNQKQAAAAPAQPALNAAVRAEAQRLADATRQEAAQGAAFRLARPTVAASPAAPPVVGAASAPSAITAARAEAGATGAVREADAARAAGSAAPAPAAAPLDSRARRDTLAKTTPPPPPPSRVANALESATEAAQAALTGTVTYRTRTALPPGAVIEVRLLDVSRADAPADTLARTEIVTRGEQVPLPFTLRYAADQIQPRRRYRVQATIAIDGRVAWRTTTAYPVFVDGAATTRVDVVVDPVR